MTDTEAQMMTILNTPPTIPNIPKVEMYIPTTTNPFQNRTYLEKTLRVPRHQSKWLSRLDTISVIVSPTIILSFLTSLVELLLILSVPPLLLYLKVLEYLPVDRLHYFPRTIQEVKVFLRSLLQVLQFAHSRDVMNRDLYPGNVYFDGTLVKLFDWDDGAVYKPNSVKLRVSRTHLKNPPEGWNNASALHPTVSGYDIWNVGIIMRNLWSHIEVPSDKAQVSLLKDFVKTALTEDPYKRPDASELLNHPFLAENTKLRKSSYLK